MDTLHDIDQRLLALDFKPDDLPNVEDLLTRRNNLVQELAVQLRRSLDNGAEITRRLAGCRNGLSAQLQRSSHVALHQYVADDIPGDPC